MRVTIADIKEMKAKKQKFTMMVAYDYSMARLVDEAGVPLILVGDSLGMVMLGYESTIPVTMDEMIHHTKAVVRGARKALVVGDMPFMTYHIDMADSLVNAARFIQEAGAQAVKLEGGVKVAEIVRRIVDCGIPVMGHIGLTPQSIHTMGGLKEQGKSPEAAVRLLKDAQALDQAGVFSIVLEAVPAPLARIVTEKVSVPTIGIGAGIDCDGQVQVIHDVLGLYTDVTPKHAKQYAKLAGQVRSALSSYVDEVSSGAFPTPQNAYVMDESALEELK